jgi:heme/copper-type cytochrome/quinol oxidase subunit 2
VRLDVSPVDDTGKAVNSGADTNTETRTVWLIPYWLVALVAVVVLLVFVRIIWVLASRATRAKQARAEKSAPAPAPEERAFPDSEYEQ